MGESILKTLGDSDLLKKAKKYSEISYKRCKQIVKLKKEALKELEKFKKVYEKEKTIK